MLKCAKPSIETATRCFESGFHSRKFQQHNAAQRAQFQAPMQELSPRPFVCSSIVALEDTRMGRGILLWLLGVPIPVIILLWLFFGR